MKEHVRRDLGGLPEDRSSGRAPFYRTSWAVVVGIDDYAGRHPPLGNARRDAEAVAALLRDDYRFVPEQVQTLYDRTATKRAIMTALWDNLRRQTHADDQIIFYFAGHGTTESTTRAGFLIPCDAEPDTYADYIHVEEIRRFCQVVAAKHVLLILDCCFSGILAVAARDSQSGSTVVLDDAYLQQVTAKRAWQVLTAGAEDERVADSGAYPGHSAFTGALLAGLRGAAYPEGAAAITAGQLYHYLAPKVVHETQQGQVAGQRPFFNTLSGSESGEVIFIHPQAASLSLLPADLVKALQNPDDYARLGAVSHLGGYLDDPLRSAAARRQLLECIAEDTSGEVVRAAQRLLAETDVPLLPGLAESGPIPSDAPAGAAIVTLPMPAATSPLPASGTGAAGPVQSTAGAKTESSPAPAAPGAGSGSPPVVPGSEAPVSPALSGSRPAPLSTLGGSEASPSLTIPGTGSVSPPARPEVRPGSSLQAGPGPAPDVLDVLSPVNAAAPIGSAVAGAAGAGGERQRLRLEGGSNDRSSLVAETQVAALRGLQQSVARLGDAITTYRDRSRRLTIAILVGVLLALVAVGLVVRWEAVRAQLPGMSTNVSNNYLIKEEGRFKPGSEGTHTFVLDSESLVNVSISLLESNLSIRSKILTPDGGHACDWRRDLLVDEEYTYECDEALKAGRYTILIIDDFGSGSSAKYRIAVSKG